MTNELTIPQHQSRAEAMHAFGLTPDDAPLLLARIAAMTSADALVIGSALILYDHIAADLRALLNRFIEADDLSEAEENLLFWGIHIIAGARDAAAFPDIIRLFSLPEGALESLIGDAATITVPKIIAGTFDGDLARLTSLIEARDADPFLRWAGLTSLAFLTFDGRIDPATTEQFLHAFYERRLFDEPGVVGYAWSLACALGGFDRLAPMVRAAFDENLIDDLMYGYEEWTSILAEAHERPTDVARFHKESAGYFEDLYTDMAWVVDPETGDGLDTSLDEEADWLPPPEPIRNPLRNIGRNDPCPCGSGKKYKKCCLK